MKSTLSLALGTALALTIAGCSKTDNNAVTESAPATRITSYNVCYTKLLRVATRSVRNTPAVSPRVPAQG